MAPGSRRVLHFRARTLIIRGRLIFFSKCEFQKKQNPGRAPKGRPTPGGSAHCSTAASAGHREMRRTRTSKGTYMHLHNEEEMHCIPASREETKRARHTCNVRKAFLSAVTKL